MYEPSGKLSGLDTSIHLVQKRVPTLIVVLAISASAQLILTLVWVKTKAYLTRVVLPVTFFQMLNAYFTH
ncbi:MAG: hypothetical protein CM1200mP16_07310 [Nitrospina sp.]|nr:MAG: hypothetical protein CM1200mP16_07310 [Nitrospina sp.]